MIAPSLSSFSGRREDLVEFLLAEQQSLTAVERFSAHHDSSTDRPHQERYYRDLLPLNAPGPGEQYAFEVDLDRCSGCKACVTACHSLNGLEPGETWRQVGLLHDPSTRRMQQTVTTACHHCLEPGCAQGCPTLAYEKDPATGIVRHLDDQCFGCQYCLLKCPYDVPQYSAKKGIVRKCDLCVGRLQAGEAPACVQACPTQAIRIVLVETAPLRANPSAAMDLPGAPDPAHTLPTTRYVSARGLPRDPDGRPGLRPVDAHRLRAEPAHFPLVFMLVLSQAAAGFWILHALLPTGGGNAPFLGLPRLETIGLLWVLASLAVSPLHLGRPLLAWKAVLNWRRSWLSREVLAFAAFAGAAAAALLAVWAGYGAVLAPLTALAALAALYASAMVYRDTPRALWATPLTFWRFALTAALAGGAAYAAALGRAGAWFWILPAAQALKLALEARAFRHADDEEPGPLWKAAQLMRGPYGFFWRLRVALGAGSAALAAAMAAGQGPSGLVYLLLPLVLAGEIMERILFFVTAAAPRMPGGR